VTDCWLLYPRRREAQAHRRAKVTAGLWASAECHCERSKAIQPTPCIEFPQKRSRPAQNEKSKMTFVGNLLQKEETSLVECYEL